MKNLIYEKVEEIGIIKIDRERSMNALNWTILQDLKALIDEINLDDSIRCVILTGVGEKAFCGGADIREMRDCNQTQGELWSRTGNAVFAAIEDMLKPVIAAINGFAIGGGCEIAMACDLRICAEHAFFSQPEVTLGITPGWGGTQRVPRLIGISRAKELLFTGRRIGAQEALSWGLVNRVVPKEELMDTAMDMARYICAAAPIAVRNTKFAINSGAQCDIKTGCQIEAEAFGQCFTTEDQKMAMTAFTNKQKPGKFQGR